MAYFQGAYTGLVVYPFTMDATGCAACDTFLDNLTRNNQQDSVISITCFPTEFFTPTLTDYTGDYASFISSNGTPVELSATVEITKYFYDPFTLEQYTPKNKKLYTYPYLQIESDCLSGVKTFYPERFVLSTPSSATNYIGGVTFKADGCCTPDPEIVLYPYNYDGEVKAVEHSQIIRGFPQFAYVIDSYRAWQALHTTAIQGAEVAGLAASAIGSAVSLNPGGIITSVASIATWDERNRLEREKGDTVKGSQGSNAMVATRGKGIYIRQKGLTPEYAKIIDEFFTRYGYSSGRIKVPETHIRPKWTFTKTQNCALKGDIPAESAEKIRAIFNAGITFWINASEVGNYTLANDGKPKPTP